MDKPPVKIHGKFVAEFDEGRWWVMDPVGNVRSYTTVGRVKAYLKRENARLAKLNPDAINLVSIEWRNVPDNARIEIETKEKE